MSEQKGEAKKKPLGDFNWGNLIAIAALLISIFNLVDARVKPRVEIKPTAKSIEEAPNSFSFVISNNSGRVTGPIRITLYACDSEMSKLETDPDFVSFSPPPPLPPEITVRGSEAYISIPEGVYPHSEMSVFLLVRPVTLSVWHDGEMTPIDTEVRGGCI